VCAYIFITKKMKLGKNVVFAEASFAFRNFIAKTWEIRQILFDVHITKPKTGKK